MPRPAAAPADATANTAADTDSAANADANADAAPSSGAAAPQGPVNENVGRFSHAPLGARMQCNLFA